MADLDTRSKRASSLSAMRPYMISPPLPDGTINQSDRQHIAWMYGGFIEIVASRASTYLGDLKLGHRGLGIRGLS